jgi:hypothetical protein
MPYFFSSVFVKPTTTVCTLKKISFSKLCPHRKNVEERTKSYLGLKVKRAFHYAYVDEYQKYCRHFMGIYV